MDVSQTGVTHAEKNIEASSLLMLFSEVENTAFGQYQLMQTQQEHLNEISQDAA